MVFNFSSFRGSGERTTASGVIQTGCAASLPPLYNGSEKLEPIDGFSTRVIEVGLDRGRSVWSGSWSDCDAGMELDERSLLKGREICPPWGWGWGLRHEFVFEVGGLGNWNDFVMSEIFPEWVLSRLLQSYPGVRLSISE